MFVPVSIVLPHLFKGRLVDRIPSENAFFALLDGSVELVSEEYVCYPVRVFSFVVLEESERSNFSQLLSLKLGLFVDLSRSAVLSGFFGL